MELGIDLRINNTRRTVLAIKIAVYLPLKDLLGFHIQQYGTHLKANAALVRLRLYDVLGLLPPTLYEDKFGPLLRELVAEFTLTDNPANTTTSLLRAMCHADDNVIMGKMCCTMYMNFACDCI